MMASAVICQIAMIQNLQSKYEEIDLNAINVAAETLTNIAVAIGNMKEVGILSLTEDDINHFLNVHKLNHELQKEVNESESIEN